MKPDARTGASGPSGGDFDRILVVKLADLGDLLTATPALRALRLRFPRARVSALVTPHTACLLEGNDAVDEVLVFPKDVFDRPSALLRLGSLLKSCRLALDLSAARFDAAILLHHLTTRWGSAKYRALLAATGARVKVGLDNGAGHFLTARAVDRGFGARHEVDYWLDVVAVLGAHHPSPSLELHLTAAEIDAGAERWQSLGLKGRPVVTLHPGSGRFSVARRWPADRFAAAGDMLSAAGLDVVIVAGPGEEPVAQAVLDGMRSKAVLLHDVGSPRSLAGLLRNSSLFVGNDSGVMHCAAAVGVPVVGVFGLSNHRAWGPYPPERHRVVRLELSCSPCFYTGFGLGTPDGCAPRTCLTSLAPGLVVQAALDLCQSERGLPPREAGRPDGVGTRE
jgi:heptosyltransferase-2